MGSTSQFVTARDLAICRMVYEYQGCSIDHIRRRFFPTPGSRTPCYRRVARLVQQGFLASTRLPSFSGVGSGRAFLTIGQNARLVLAEVLGLSRSELTRTRMDSPLFISHHLAICDVRLAFERAADHSNVLKVEEWIGERELHQSPLRVKDPLTAKDLTIVPDSVFTLASADGSNQNFILEIDMGTIAARRLRAKLRAYLLADIAPMPVLFVVPGPSRQAQIVQYVLQEAHDLNRDPTSFSITTREVITDGTVFSSPIWQVVGVEEPISLEDLVLEKEPFLAVAPAPHPGYSP